ncbi:MAG: hypothetical protein JWM18_4582 [Chloroflexi bacterium]|nr:hypothetical protein [Chloroflexota bacterium]
MVAARTAHAETRMITADVTRPVRAARRRLRRSAVRRTTRFAGRSRASPLSSELSVRLTGNAGGGVEGEGKKEVDDAIS